MIRNGESTLMPTLVFILALILLTGCSGSTDAGGGSAQSADSAPATLVIKVGGMTCEGCVSGIEEALAGMRGVDSATVSLEQGMARVVMPEAHREALEPKVLAIIRGLEFTAEVQADSP